MSVELSVWSDNKNTDGWVMFLWHDVLLWYLLEGRMTRKWNINEERSYRWWAISVLEHIIKETNRRQKYLETNVKDGSHCKQQNNYLPTYLPACLIKQYNYYQKMRGPTVHAHENTLIPCQQSYSLCSCLANNQESDINIACQCWASWLRQSLSPF